MKLLELRIRGYQQFQDTKLDFSDKNGNPLKKICFIGKNGTGKSTLLRIIKDFLTNSHNFNSILHSTDVFYFKIQLSDKIIYYVYDSWSKRIEIFSSDIGNQTGWFENISDHPNNLKKYDRYLLQKNDIVSDLEFKNNSTDLLIYSPPESMNNTYMGVGDVPPANLNESLALFKNFPFSHTVSENNVTQFWQVLIYLIKKRDNEREEYENKPENINKTKKQLIEEFNRENPKILDKLSVFWNRILEEAGLEFDSEGANNPIQLTDNLKAYIRLKKTKQRIDYNMLSTGIRNFIFRIGHIYSLYFKREIKNGFLLLDEPENSLFPDFLFNLFEIYEQIIIDKNGENNTQFFVSTHNPIIAAQFAPEERIILEWNDEGFVDAHKGYAPIGDDPNDLLVNDFNLKNLMGKEGRKVWEEYIALRKELGRTTDKAKKSTLMEKINKIGELYNFEN